MLTMLENLLIIFLLPMSSASADQKLSSVPDWVTFPDEEWQTITPSEAGIGDIEAWNQWVEETQKRTRGGTFKGEDHSGNQWGVVITRGGYLIQTFGDPDYKYQTASLGKAFTMACLQLAIDEGLISSADDLIKDYWTGEGQLNSPHKYMNQGHHNSLTFNHLKNHTGGFPITNGWSWQFAQNYDEAAPKWANCTKDPDYDNYAHAKPGTVGSHYSSGGYWRLAQALTAVWKKDLKQVMDERIFSRIGVPADRWDWTPGKVVHDSKDWYPDMPGYGLFLDPPYEIDGQTVRGGPGWVVMSARDLARFGLLVATGGIWKGERLISSVQGHNGGNGSNVGGVGGTVMGAWGKVTSNFRHGDIPWNLFTKMPQNAMYLHRDDPSRTRGHAISLHPDNPHYLLFRGKPTVLITSGEHYGAVLNLDFDYVKYLDELQSQGLNLTRTFSGTYIENWGEGWNTLNPAPERYVAPWARSSTPGYADGGSKFDLDKWDEDYFRRLKDFVAQASKRDIVVELVLFCTFYSDELWALSPLNARNNVNNIGNKGRIHVYDESDEVMIAVQEKLVKQIASELRDFDNVYFELCNEPYIADGPKLGSSWNDRIVKAIREVSDSHLIALNVANGSVKVDEMHSGVSVFNFHYCRPPDAVAMNYHHNKVIAFDETGFKGPNADNYRRYAWDFIIAGGAVFSNLDWSFTVDSEDGRSTAAEDRLGPKDPALRPQLGHLKRFIEGFDFARMKPKNEVIKGGIPDGATARVLAEEGEAYAVYVNGGNKADLRLDIPAGIYTVEWLNTKTGQIGKTEELNHDGGGMASLDSPDYSGDIALSIRRRP